MTEEELTSEQRAIVEDTTRVVVARAGPGSGKTRVFVETFRSHIEAWTSNRSGIAALSFTNVAHNEITKRLGGPPPPPHFVGTLDSFVLRFIVRPFGHLVGMSQRGAQLIPAPLDRDILYPLVRIGPTAAEQTSLFGIRFVGGGETDPELESTNRISGRTSPVPTAYRGAVLLAKQKEWRTHGRITHSDTHYLAAAIMASKHAAAVVELVSARFPVILIDEFQDTGWFLGRAVLELLKTPPARALAVGDPDQGIYEFSGADPKLFEKAESLDGAKTLPLRQSQRCAARICAVATHLSDSNLPVEPIPRAPEGRALLVIHNLSEVHPDTPLVHHLSHLTADCCEVAVLARRNQTVRRLRGVATSARFPGSSRVPRTLDYAAALLEQGQSLEAYRLAARELAALVIGGKTPTAQVLEMAGIDLSLWKRSVYTLLQSAAGRDLKSWLDWLKEVQATMEKLVTTLTRKPTKLGLKFTTKKVAGLRAFLGTGSSARWPTKFAFSTIHQAKGAEFDCVIVFCPKPHKRNAPCPSSEWWKPSPNEERRIAYVAATRARQTLILCVHRQTYKELRPKRPDFLSLFDASFVRSGHE